MKIMLAGILTILATAGLCRAAPLTISNAPGGWDHSPGTQLSESGGALHAKSMESAIWISPKAMLTYQPKTGLTVDYKLRGGNIIAQADWFDANGTFIGTSELGRGTAANTRLITAIAAEENAGRKAKSFRLKLWVEADMPRLTLNSVRLVSAPGKKPMLQQNDFANGQNLTANIKPDGDIELTLLSEGSHALNAAKRFDVADDQAFDVSVDSLTAHTACSVQLIFWDENGTYLGYHDVFKDATKSATSKVMLAELPLPEGTESYSFKFWLTGPRGAEAKLNLTASSW